MLRPLLTRDGWVYCGRGQCLMTLDGKYICSEVEGGSVVKQVDGTVRYEGSCEPASWQLCERMPAGR